MQYCYLIIMSGQNMISKFGPQFYKVPQVSLLADYCIIQELVIGNGIIHYCTVLYCTAEACEGWHPGPAPIVAFIWGCYLMRLLLKRVPS